MNKVAAEIIAGLIPRKMARNRWRGILRYGVIKALKLKFRLKRDHRKPDCRLAVCAIAKDEGPYFKEWLDWHISQGVEKFYIYDNESTDCTREVLRPYIESGVVEYCYYPGYRRQIAAYDDCMDRHRFDTRWLAFIDLDEFIVPIADSSIPEFLKRFEDSPAVEINWLIYGSGGAEKKSTDPVMQRFRHHSLPGHRLNRHVKSIVDP
ncbi:glycosyltransferase family 92 protein, partial [Duncaniella muris]